MGYREFTFNYTVLVFMGRIRTKIHNVDRQDPKIHPLPLRILGSTYWYKTPQLSSLFLYKCIRLSLFKLGITVKKNTLPHHKNCGFLIVQCK